MVLGYATCLAKKKFVQKNQNKEHGEGDEGNCMKVRNYKAYTTGGGSLVVNGVLPRGWGPGGHRLEASENVPLYLANLRSCD